MASVQDSSPDFTAFYSLLLLCSSFLLGSSFKNRLRRPFLQTSLLTAAPSLVSNKIPSKTKWN